MLEAEVEETVTRRTFPLVQVEGNGALVSSIVLETPAPAYSRISVPVLHMPKTKGVSITSLLTERLTLSMGVHSALATVVFTRVSFISVALLSCRWVTVRVSVHATTSKVVHVGTALRLAVVARAS